jgi:hypothetical protein
MRHRSASTLAIVGLSLAFTASLACAQDTVRVRGTVQGTDGDTIVVKSRDGTDLKIVPASNATFAAVVKASLADVKPGKFVGVTAMPQADGTQQAVEVHIFPEAARGTGEGHYAWDLMPGAMMTNANVETVMSGVNGRNMKLTYKGGSKDVIVPDNVPVVTPTAATRADLMVGKKVFVFAEGEAPNFRALRVTVEKDGVAPPM